MSCIVHFTQCLGGVETYIQSFHAHGAMVGFEKRVLVVPGECSLSRDWRSAGGQVVVLEMPRALGVHDVRLFFDLLTLLRVQKPDVIHLHSSKAGALGRAAAFCCRLLGQRTKVVYTPHAYYFLAHSGVKRAILVFVERLLSHFTDVLLATSHSEAARSCEEVKYPREKIRVVSNGVEVSEGGTNSSKHAGKNLSVSFVGRICWQKNIDLLAELIGRFSPDDCVRFRVVGVGHYEEDLQRLDALFAAHRVDRSIVEIVPWVSRDRVLELFKQSDVCIVTSRYESFGYVAAEAGAAGVAVVATNVDGLKDIVEDGQTGFLVDGERAEDFDSCIRQLQDNPAVRQRMGDKARGRISTHFNIETNAQKLRELYEMIQ